MRVVQGLIAIGLLLPGALGAEAVDVFILTGQSNMLGTTADPGEEDPAPPADAADREIRFFWSNRSTRAGDGPAVLIGDSSGRITHLQPQQGEGQNPLFWGPEVGFARELHRREHRGFLVVKAARGGGGNGYWRKGSPDDHMYRHVVATARAALAALPAGTPFRIRALLYLQGESDNADEAEAYLVERVLELSNGRLKKREHRASSQAGDPRPAGAAMKRIRKGATRHAD